MVLDAVRSLPDAYRETLILRLVEGMTGPEIAARTGLTEGSVRVNLHRGMKLLRAVLTRGRTVTDDYLWDRNGPPDPDVAGSRPARTLPIRRAGASLAPGARSLSPRIGPVACRGCGARGCLCRNPVAGPRTRSFMACRSAGRQPGGGPCADWRRGAASDRRMARDRRLVEGCARGEHLGQLEIDPGTRLRLTESREGAPAHDRAWRVHALIWAPPDSSSSRRLLRARSIGLRVHARSAPGGPRLIEVSAGWVAFEHEGPRIVRSAGARCDTRPGVGPGTRTSQTRRQRSSRRSRLDTGTASEQAQAAALSRVLSDAAGGCRDAVAPAGASARGDRGAVFDALARRCRRRRCHA